MFEHLVKVNNLDEEFKRCFGENLDKHMTFITELIKGPPEIKPEVNEVCSLKYMYNKILHILKESKESKVHVPL